MTLFEWALKWRIPPDALNELVTTCVHVGPPEDGGSEAGVQREVRLEAARLGKYLFRNNRGAGKMESGNFVRYGLANDSKKLGDAVKSADLIGIETMYVTIDMVLDSLLENPQGFKVGRFLSVEVKAPNWKYSGTVEEMAQLKWAAAINAAGGRAIITNRTGCL